MRTHDSPSFGAIAVMTVAAVGLSAFVVGFYVLPSQYPLGTVWQKMCRAAGVVFTLQSGPQPIAPPTLTSVVVPHAAFSIGSSEQIGRGATLALRCSVCHGAQGLSRADAPNLSGQYSDVIYKQLLDFQRGARTDPVMSAIAASLSIEDVLDLSHYYAYLPRPKVQLPLSESPALVRVGDPMRNIAPCASCHSQDEHKQGAPSLDGEPKAYLRRQLGAFAGNLRKNDANAAMRNEVRQLSTAEVDLVINHYAGVSR